MNRLTSIYGKEIAHEITINTSVQKNKRIFNDIAEFDVKDQSLTIAEHSD